MGDLVWLAVRRASALLGIMVLTVLAALTLDLVQMASPVVRSGPCERTDNRWITGYPKDDGCVWEEALTARRQSADVLADVSVAVTIEERGRLPHADIRVTLPSRDPLAEAVRAGKAVHDPGLFVSYVVGEVHLGDVYLAWGAPTLGPAPGRGHVVITTQGEVPSYSRAGVRSAASVELFVHPILSTRLTVDSDERAVVASHVPGAGARIDIRKLTARLPAGRPWTVTLGSAKPSAVSPVESNPVPPPWLRRMKAVGRAVLTSWWNFAVSLPGAVPWLLLWFAGRTDAFGPARAGRPAWPRYLRLVGLVLAIHLAVSLVSAGQFDYVLQTALDAEGTFGRAVSTRLPWEPAENLGVSGLYILLVAAALTLLPAAVRRATRPTPRTRPGFSGYGWGCLAIPAASAGAASLVATGVYVEQHPVRHVAFGALTLYGGAFLVLVTLGAAARPLLRAIRGPDSSPSLGLGTATSTALVLTALAGIYGSYGYVPLATRWAVLLVAGATALLALTALCHRVVTGRRLGRRALVLLTPLALALSVPWHRLGSTYLGWELFVFLAQDADGLLAFFLSAGAVLTLRRLGRRPVTSQEQLRNHRALGIVAAVIVLSNGYSFYRAPSPWALLAALLGALCLLPRGQVARAAAVLGQDSAEHRRCLTRTVTAGAARRQLPATRRALREKTAEDGGSLAAQQLPVRRLELMAGRDREGTRDASTPTTRQRALGGLTSQRPWQRAVWGARWGLLMGLPWMALDLAGTAQLPKNDFYPLLSAAGALLPAALTWTGLGLLFGYFFPLVAGESGLAKALRLAAAAAAPTVLDAVLGAHQGSGWPAGALAVLQLLAFCLSLGLLADRDTLALRRYHWARLADVHNLGSLAAWFSTVTAALATGVAALLLAGLQPFMTHLVEPPQSRQSDPPASTAGP
ncbi:hypothetical protein NHG22_11345 [Streptomyces sp. ATE26]|uniref:hypothetical protein n=1 Tax=Streptomyces sp. ATE26 TaxID=2954237 RepID=UPI0024830972|nr:hypothetical protein [Streptomyces sp. ATE26]MDI1454399.1 hypothetical protein [Streptomyces sp. ATE26]